MIRELINRINRSWSERIVAARRRHSAPMKVWFDPHTKTEIAREAARGACLLGETVDLSRTGIAFSVASIRDKEKYLVGQERGLNVELDLPGGRVHMRVVGRRYEKVGMHISTERFLVGAQILELEGADKECYEAFLRRGPRGVRGTAGALELGVD